MSLNVNSNNSKDLDSMFYKKVLTIQKDQLPKRHFDYQYSPNDKFGVVAMNADANKAELQEMAKIISQSKEEELTEDKKIKVVSTAAKADDTEEDEEHNSDGAFCLEPGRRGA